MGEAPDELTIFVLCKYLLKNIIDKIVSERNIIVCLCVKEKDAECKKSVLEGIFLK